jgi:glucose/arabinose dehydrogenase
MGRYGWRVPGGARIGTRAFAIGIAAVLAVALAASSLASATHSGQHQRAGHKQAGFTKRKIGSFAAPTYVTHAPGAPSFLYVVEQRGTVAVVDRGDVRAQPFLDIRGRVSSGGERGLLSIAFDPHYATNHLFYAYYTNSQGNIEIDEFHASSNTLALASSRRTVIVVPHPIASNHNGGQLEFGPDGYLYAGTGDGGGSGDPHRNAQNKDVLLGKLLRIDPHQSGTKPYTVPATNPYVGKPGRDEIYALGLRNPYRFSFDRGWIVIGDVGQDRWEEVDYEAPSALRGANFGWNHFEGDHLFSYPGVTVSPRPRHNYRPPIFEYAHGSNRCAIIGGYVVRDPSLGSLRGRYLYTDNCAGGLRSFVPHRNGGTGDQALGVHVPDPSSFGEGVNGAIYVASLDGPVYKLVR